MLLSTSKAKRIIGLLYLLFLGYLLYFAPFRHDTITEVNLVPFNSYDEFAEMFRPSSILYWIANVPGNVIAFIPFTLIFYWLGGIKKSWVIAILFAFLIPSLIEFFQYLFQVGVCNIDDVFLNALGYLLGYGILRKKIKKIVSSSPPKSE